MMESNDVPRQWDVWHARFNYEGKSGCKYRPVVVVGASDSGLLVVMVTSSTNTLRLEHDHLLMEWKAAGLEKPSIARIDRIAEIPLNYLGTAGRIGRLASADIDAISAILESLYGDSAAAS